MRRWCSFTRVAAMEAHDTEDQKVIIRGSAQLEVMRATQGKQREVYMNSIAKSKVKLTV